jgi:hypothetical protein
MKMGNFQDRLKQYKNPSSKAWWDGESTSQNIARWSRRASENSDGHRHRAKSGEVELPSTRSPPSSFHPTAGTASGVGKLEAARYEAKRDKNNVGSSGYMHGVRRTTD